MTVRNLIQYKVVGRGQFPVDMLRYDRAMPRSERDAGIIEESLTRRGPQAEHEVKIEGLKEPTVDRWTSFGWQVVGPFSKRAI